MILIDINNLIISISNSKFVSHGHLKLMNNENGSYNET